jgi:OOP family OmpA-OmpF porin
MRAALVLVPLLLCTSLASADPVVRLEGGQIRLATPLTFAAGTASLEPSTTTTLDAVAALLRSHGTMTIEIGAHSDSRGADTFNLAMTQRRADAVRAALILRGIPRTRLTAVGYGETRPIADDRTEAGREANRRIELVVVHP